MGQKVNPISVRLEQTNKHFDSCWYGDYQYSYLLNEDLKVKSYINNILKQMRCPETHISMIYMAKKIKILFCYLDPRHSRYSKSSRLYLKLVNKNNNKNKKKQIKREFFKNQFVARYLQKKNKNNKTVFSMEKHDYIKYNGSIPFVTTKKGIAMFSKKTKTDNLIYKNVANGHVGGNLKISSKKSTNNLQPNYSFDENTGKLGFASKSLNSVMNNLNTDVSNYAKKKRDPRQPRNMPVSASLNKKRGNGNKERKEILSLKLQKNKVSLVDSPGRNIKYKKSLKLDDFILPCQPAPYSPLVTRKNPFRILLAFYRKRKRKKKNSNKKTFSRLAAPISVVSKKGLSRKQGGRPLKNFRQILKNKGDFIASLDSLDSLATRNGDLAREASDGSQATKERQASFWRYLTNLSASRMAKKVSKNDTLFSDVWNYLFFNQKSFFNKVIQRKKGYQTWHKSLFIRYLLLFIYKKRFKFFASPINYSMGSHIFQVATPSAKNLDLSRLVENSNVKYNLNQLNKKNTKNLSTQSNRPVSNNQTFRNIGLTINTDKKRLATKNLDSGLIKYHLALESINRIEWFQGRGMAFLWFIFNSVNPSQRVIKTPLVMANSGENLFFPSSRKGYQSLLKASPKTNDNLKLYINPYGMTPSEAKIVNKIKNFHSSNCNKVPSDDTRKKTVSNSILTRKAKPSAVPSRKPIYRVNETQIFRSCPPKTIPSLILNQQNEKKRAKIKTFNHRSTISKKEQEKYSFNTQKKHNYLKTKTINKALSMPRKLFYPRTVKSKGFLSYMEYILSSQLKNNVRLFSWKTRDEKKSALFLVEQIVYFLQKRVPFSRIKQQMWREFKLGSMQGLRITYSGRLGGRSKKAQRSRRKTFQWGQTSSHVFASKLSFASKYALTIFGKIGIKIWVCYR